MVFFIFVLVHTAALQDLAAGGVSCAHRAPRL